MPLDLPGRQLCAVVNSAKHAATRTLPCLQGMLIFVGVTLASAVHMAEKRFTNWNKHMTNNMPDKQFLKALHRCTSIWEPFLWLSEANRQASQSELVLLPAPAATTHGNGGKGRSYLNDNGYMTTAGFSLV